MTHSRWRVTRNVLLLIAVLAFANAQLLAQPAQPEPTPAPGVEEPAPQELDVIRRALQKLLPIPGQPGPKTPLPDAPATKSDQSNDPADKRELDAYDKLVPLDPDTQADWSRAQKQAANGNWGPVLQSIKRLNERSEDSLTVLEDGSVTSLRRAALRLLSKAPRDVRETFERTHRADGERLLKEALTEQSLDKLSEVATLFFWMEPGYVAADALATRLMDRGDTGIALTWFKQLWEAQASLVLRSNWQRKALIAARIVGDSAFERLLAKELGADAHAELLSKFQPRQRQFVEPISDWPMFLGSPQRNALARGGEPVDLQRWRTSTTSNTPLQNSIDNLFEHLTEHGLPAIPTAMPLLVDGKVVFRSFSGLEVLDAESGRLLWSLEDALSADAMLMDGSVAMAFGGPNGAALLQGNVRNSTGGPLGQYLFQNSNHSLLSSDGRRLFVVDDNPLIALYQTSGRISARAAKSAAANRLSANVLRAYDLETGRMLWQIGGPEVTEDLTTQLAGQFFLGAPVIDGDDLFVVGQRDTEIRLHVLEPATGHVKWSQLLSYAELPIERDSQRRVWAIQPAVQGSLVLCPTTVGWLVAVDRSRHSVLWAQRYFDRQKAQAEDSNQPGRLFGFGGGQPIRTLSEDIGKRWAASAPIIARNCVLMTPIEADESDPTDNDSDDESAKPKAAFANDALQCFDLYSGKRVWRRNRDELDYVAGAWNDLFILVGRDQVQAVALDGTLKWKAEFPVRTLLASGRGILADGFLYQPTLHRQVLKVDLATGKLAATIDLSERERPLGNLLLYRGLLISHHPSEVVALEQLAAVEQRLAQANQQAPQSLDSQLLEAELALSRGHDEAALKLLKKISVETSKTELKARHEKALRRALVKAVRANIANREGALAELEGLVRTPEDRQEFDELAVNVLVESSKFEAALHHLLMVARRADDALLVRSETIRAVPQSQIRVAESAWVEGLMRDLLPQLDQKSRASIDREVEQLLKEVTVGTTPPRAEKIVRMLDAHPAVMLHVERFAAEASAAKQYVLAQFWLDVAARHAATPAARFEKTLQQSQLSLDLSDFPAADAQLAKLTYEAQNTELPSGQTLSAAVTALRTKLATATAKSAPTFNPQSSSLLHMPNQHVSNPTIALEPSRRRPDFFARLHFEAHKFEYSPTAERLHLTDTTTGATYWSLPLRSQSPQQGELQIQRSGRSVIVFNGGVLQAFSLPDRRALWSVPIATAENTEDFDGLDLDSVSIDMDQPHQLVPAKEFLAGTLGSVVLGDGLLFANADVVAIRAKQQLQVFDARTGELRWMARKLINDVTTVIGTSETLWIVNDADSENGDREVLAFRTLDGKPLPAPETPQEIFGTVFIDEDIVISAVLSQDSKQVMLQARDHKLGQIVWKHEFDARTEFCKTADDELVAFTREGQLIRIELWNGRRVDSPAPPPEMRVGRNWRQVVTDRDHVYLLLNARARGESVIDLESPRHTFGSMASLWSHGKLIAFSREDGRQLWARNTSNQALVLNDFVANPTLLMLHYQRDTFGFSGELALQVLNKQTGQPLLDQIIATDQLSFTSAQWDPTSRMIDLFGFERRYRLMLKP